MHETRLFTFAYFTFYLNTAVTEQQMCFHDFCVTENTSWTFHFQYFAKQTENAQLSTWAY